MTRETKRLLQRDASSLGSMSNDAQPSLGELEHRAKWELRTHLSDILIQLDIDEVIGLIFLVMSTKDLANKGYAWMHYAQQEKIHEDLSQMVEHPEALKSILEAIYVIQRFDILDNLGLCAIHGYNHKVCANLNSLTQSRKALYQVFNGLIEAEANDIVKSLQWERPVDGELLEMTFTRNLTPNNYEMLIYDLGQKLQQHGFANLSECLHPHYPHDIRQTPVVIPSAPVPSTSPSVSTDFYPPPTSTPHGICMIINIKEFLPPKTSDDKIPLETRHGSDIDVRRLQATFTILGFKVYVSVNLDQEGIMRRFELLRKQKILASMASLVVVFMSHGDEDHVFLHDRKCIEISKLRELCFAEGLIGKPRLFFIQACRGNLALKPVLLVRDSPQITNHTKDCLISYSTIKGYSAFRSTTEGSCYISYLCETLQKYGDKESVTKVLRRTRKRMCDWMELYGSEHVTQMSEDQSTLEKEVQFYRGNEDFFVHGVCDLIMFEVIEKEISVMIDSLDMESSGEEMFHESSFF
ncbi:uncharacterized protein LOC143021717 [Oratosquilla oratoria]|uniref:uncharacterized protein LOC143021717 n=1 Tax=Oratosquilla oratoria TaxID=337810 RepID=UPI003F772B59